MKFAKLISILLLTLTAHMSHAAMSPLSVGVVPPVQFPPGDFSVTGLRTSLFYGQHRDMYGLDIGVLGNITEQRFVGLGVSGLFNITRGQASILGLQFAGVTNVATQKMNVVGVQMAGLVNSLSAESSVNGLQVAILANLAAHTTIRGIQLGLYNRARTVHGVQLGLVNVTDSLRGIQIGLVNFHHTGIFAVSPIINVGF